MRWIELTTPNTTKYMSNSNYKIAEVSYQR